MGKSKIIAVVGPTSSGKSELAVILAKKFNGEIISADSRQVYKGMDIGTGKVPGKWTAITIGGKKKPVFLYKGIPHHLIDFIDPKKQYSASLFQKHAQAAIEEIQARGRLPIICGGTGHWVDAAVLGQSLPNVPPNKQLRKKLDAQSIESLFEQLKVYDPDRAEVIDWHNKRRLVRALEIVLQTGKPVPKLEQKNNYQTLWLGISWPQEELYAKIDRRLKARLKAGMVNEIEKLRKNGLSWKRLFELGLEYRYVSLYLQGKLGYKEMAKELSIAIKHYAKRQITWFKKNDNILWVQSGKGAANLAKSFLA